METLLNELASSSPISVIAIFTIWRMSLIMMTLVEAFVAIAREQSENVTELVEKS